MTLFISHIHEDIRQSRRTKRGATTAPDKVPRGLHKEYTRMEKIQLPDPMPVSMTIGETMERRTSYDHGSNQGIIPLETWGTLLGLALKRREGSHKRNYPSGGALYPIETYLIGNSIEGSRPAAFHYNPTAHALEKLWDLPSDLNLKDLAPKPDTLHFSAIIVFTAVWKRSSAKYGDLAYTHGLLEAGHMSENILLVATALSLNTRPMAGFNDGLIATILDLPELEQSVHSIVLST